MKPKHLVTAALFVLSALMLGDCSGAGPTSEARSGVPAEVVSQSPTRRARSKIGFASRKRLVEHYRKHGREFGTITMQEYLLLAQQLRDRSVGGDVLEIVRSDRVITRFERSSGSFIAFNPDGIIRTFFKPNQGETYFRRQGQRGE